MTASHDDRHLVSIINGEKIELFTEYIIDDVPRLFSLCRDDCDAKEDYVFAWGAAFEDNAVLFRPNGKIIGTFQSAHSALNLFSRTHNLALIWNEEL